jgi:hypothetical protein
MSAKANALLPVIPRSRESTPSRGRLLHSPNRRYCFVLASQNEGMLEGELDNLVRLYSVKVVRPYTRAYEAARGFHGDLGRPSEEKCRESTDHKGSDADRLFDRRRCLADSGLCHGCVEHSCEGLSLNFICNNNLERAFKVAALIDSSPVASYIVGELWDQGQSYISDKVKAALELSGPNFAAMQRFTTTPLAAGTYFHDFIDDAATKIFAVTKDLRESNLSDAEKIHALNKLKSSQFCKGAPAHVDENASREGH